MYTHLGFIKLLNHLCEFVLEHLLFLVKPFDQLKSLRVTFPVLHPATTQLVLILDFLVWHKHHNNAENYLLALGPG